LLAYLKAGKEPKIDSAQNAVVDRIEGERTVRQLRLRNIKDGIISLLRADGLFVAVGVEPKTGYLPGILPLDEKGCIITNEAMETGILGILAAGDCATAALSVRRFVNWL